MVKTMLIYDNKVQFRRIVCNLGDVLVTGHKMP